jgi:hypothetical protein
MYILLGFSGLIPIAIVLPAMLVGPIEVHGAGTNENIRVSVLMFFDSAYALKYLSAGISALGYARDIVQKSSAANASETAPSFPRGTSMSRTLRSPVRTKTRNATNKDNRFDIVNPPVN